MGFHLFKSSEKLTIPDNKEELLKKPYTKFDPEFVYVPLSRNGKPLREIRGVGDYVARGTLLALDDDNFPIYSSVSGYIKDKKEMDFANGHMMALVIQNDHKHTFELRKPLGKVADVSKEEIYKTIKYSGCIGFGGAGFPTYKKYQKPAQYLFINAVECEPYLACDYLMGISHINLVFAAIPYLLKLTGAKKVYFVAKERHELLIEEAINESKKHPSYHVEVVKVPDVYPMGYERSIISYVLHKKYDKLPIEVGAIVNNIYTYMMLGERFIYGTVPVSRCITVAGLVKRPQSVLTPAWTLASDLIKFCGGRSTKRPTMVVDGGPMAGKAHRNDFVTCLETNGVLVFRDKYVRPEPCWHCGDCCSNCPMDLQPVQIQMALKNKDIDRLITLEADKCINCGLCSYVCPAHIDVSNNVQIAKALVIKAKRGEKK